MREYLAFNPQVRPLPLPTQHLRHYLICILWQFDIPHFFLQRQDKFYFFSYCKSAGRKNPQIYRLADFPSPHKYVGQIVSWWTALIVMSRGYSPPAIASICIFSRCSSKGRLASRNPHFLQNTKISLFFLFFSNNVKKIDFLYDKFFNIKKILCCSLAPDGRDQIGKSCCWVMHIFWNQHPKVKTIKNKLFFLK